MSSSSSFAFSHRRRSHSTSSPSPSPAPPSLSRSAHKRAHSSHRDTPTLTDAQRCHLDAWRNGKRLRRDISPPQTTRSSSADSLTTSSSSSPPHTPLFPTSSTDFLLSPPHPVHTDGPTLSNPHSPSFPMSLFHDDASSQPELARLKAAAFSELQRSVRENGEGFIKRMREFEDSRSKSAQHSRARGIERRRKKRYSPTTRSSEKCAASDDDDDILILSSAFGADPFYPRQKRSSSLGAMDDSNFQLPGGTNSSGRLSPIPNIFHHPPFAHYPSHVCPVTTNHPPGTSVSFGPSFGFSNSLHINTFKPASSHSSSDSLASSTDVSQEDTGYWSPSPMASASPSPNLSVGTRFHSASSAEKAIAAISLAMANGAGSLGDYEAVRAFNVSSADESQVGELWH